jgi:hypothetical protein
MPTTPPQQPTNDLRGELKPPPSAALTLHHPVTMGLIGRERDRQHNAYLRWHHVRIRDGADRIACCF